MKLATGHRDQVLLGESTNCFRNESFGDSPVGEQIEKGRQCVRMECRHVDHCHNRNYKLSST